ncbi:phosphopantetheine-binding protein [Nonomuraea longicatena]
MAPAAIVALDTLPRTPGGKLERAALPAPLLAGGRDTEPCSAAERTLCELFTEVLGVTARPRDSFFDLGGHSLLADRLAGRIWESFGVRLPVKEVFSGPTPAELAARLPAQAAADAAVVGAVQALVPAPRRRGRAGVQPSCRATAQRADGPQGPVHGHGRRGVPARDPAHGLP